MKVLLTSAGIQNKSMVDEFVAMLPKPVSECKAVLVPTASNVESQDKRWFIEEGLVNFYNVGIQYIDIVDPSADGVDWLARCDDADLIIMSGGNTFHLLDQLRKTGFDSWLKENIEDKVYVGISAGSIVATPNIRVSAIEPADPNTGGISDLTGLGIVDFEIEPHCDEKRFAMLEKWMADKKGTLYALDDDSAVSIIDGKVVIISEGKYKKLEGQV
jgi:dipeptidase E